MHDVAIVGGGPVGVATAIALAQHDVDVVVLERRTRPLEHSRAIGIHPPALELFERWGCLQPLLEAGLPIRMGEVRCGGAVLGSLVFETTGGRHPFILSVPQQITERVLRCRLAELAPQALVVGAEATGLEAIRDGSGILVRTTRGAVNARWVIGADGPHGLTRSCFSTRRRIYPDRYVMADAPDHTALNGAVLFFEANGVVESFPLPGGMRRWVIHLGYESAAGSTDAGSVSGGSNAGGASGGASVGEAAAKTAEIALSRSEQQESRCSERQLLFSEHADDGEALVGRATDADAFARLVGDRTGIELDPRELTTPSPFGVRHARAGPWDPNVLNGCLALVGDAAHEISPIGGQGMTLGWLNAADLADVLADIVGDSEGGGADGPGRSAQGPGRSGGGPGRSADDPSRGAKGPGRGEGGRGTPDDALRAWAITAERRQRIAARQASFNTAMGRPRGPVALALRNLLVRGIALPPLEKRLARIFTMAAPARLGR
ncbi:FAD-dependent oxidoreductase [Humibacter albus]|uniref:FAD-dependent oxidoreductase n=1 Tax=Humibacter albus TaxID=427754 RepID=UPI0003B37193|nr:NAD(P)/FAD-dependent oxidoreductase [Humibacter albus]